MNHEAASLASRDSGQHQGADAALAVGATCHAKGDGEIIELTQVTADFVFWLNPHTGSAGRMQRAHFLNFFTPISQ